MFHIYAFDDVMKFKILKLQNLKISRTNRRFERKLKTFFLVSSRSELFFKIGVLKNFTIILGKNLCWCIFFGVLQAKDSCVVEDGIGILIPKFDKNSENYSKLLYVNLSYVSVIEKNVLSCHISRAA